MSAPAPGHGAGFLDSEGVGRGKQPHPPGQGDHLDFLGEAHAGLLQPLAEVAVDQANGGEVLHAGETGRLHLGEEARHGAERIGAAHPGQDGRALHDGQDLAGHVHDDAVGVAIGHHARQRAAPRHAEPPGVVDDDQVDAAGLGALGAEAGAGPAADDGDAVSNLLAEAGKDGFAHGGGLNG